MSITVVRTLSSISHLITNANYIFCFLLRSQGLPVGTTVDVAYSVVVVVKIPGTLPHPFNVDCLDKPPLARRPRTNIEWGG